MLLANQGPFIQVEHSICSRNVVVVVDGTLIQKSTRVKSLRPAEVKKQRKSPCSPGDER